MSELDIPAVESSPAELIAAIRRDLDETIVAYSCRRTARAVLFVGGGWPTIAGAPNGLPLFVRRTDEACDCARLGMLPETSN